eukprot:TRINITY_DN20295_c0_g1_i1.p1 TRINITY_DN20295_c0_g1~~TRINITY_DN20295_c0_g1_i1.p1  ORF type:complete len:215 (+),score=-16.31 TRINITY_DN20295_c0_g1_i1:1072-1716(+)
MHACVHAYCIEYITRLAYYYLCLYIVYNWYMRSNLLFQICYVQKVVSISYQTHAFSFFCIIFFISVKFFQIFQQSSVNQNIYMLKFRNNYKHQYKQLRFMKNLYNYLQFFLFFIISQQYKSVIQYLMQQSYQELYKIFLCVDYELQILSSCFPFNVVVLSFLTLFVAKVPFLLSKLLLSNYNTCEQQYVEHRICNMEYEYSDNLFSIKANAPFF